MKFLSFLPPIKVVFNGTKPFVIRFWKGLEQSYLRSTLIQDRISTINEQTYLRTHHLRRGNGIS